MALRYWYPLHQDLNDWSGNNAGALTTSGTSTTTGLLGNCYTLAGSGYLKFPNYVNLYREGNTLMVWVKPDAVTNYNLFGISSTTGTVDLIELRTNYMYCETTNNCGFFSSPNFTWAAGEWMHLAVVFKDRRSYWYINGQYLGETPSYGTINCDGTKPITEMYDDTRLLYIGTGGYNSTFSGALQDIRIYDHAVSDKEIYEIAKAPVVHYTAETFNTNDFYMIEPYQTYTTAILQPSDTDYFGNTGTVYEVTSKIRFGAADGSFNATVNYGYDWMFSVWLRKSRGSADLTTFEFDIVDTRTVLYKIDESGNILSTISTSNQLNNELTDTWQRFAVGATHANNSNYNFIDVGWYQSGIKWQYSNPQLHRGLLPSKFVPKENGVVDGVGLYGNAVNSTTGSVRKSFSTPDPAIGTQAIATRNKELRGTSSYMFLRAPSVFVPNQGTVSTWMKGNLTTQPADNIYPVGWRNFCLMGPSGGTGNRNGIIWYNTSSTYTSLSDYSAVWDDTWHMHTFTYDNTAGTIKFYIDGVLKQTKTGQSFYFANSFRDFDIGSAWSDTYGGLTGEIDDVRVYAKVLTDTEVSNMYKTKGSITKQAGLVVNEPDIHGFQPNILDYSTWTVGATSAVGFGRNGGSAENIIETDQNPVGEVDVVWAARNNDTTSGADGGFNTSNFPVDNTKTYRFSIWIKREVTGNGTWYWGTHGYDSGGGVQLETLSGTSTSNPYFIATSSALNNEWFLVVAYVYAVGTGTATYSDSGTYNVKGELLTGTTSYRWTTSTVYSNARSYLYYSTDPTTVQFFYRPRVDLIDGTEPTLDELLRCAEHRPLYDLYSGNSYGGNIPKITEYGTAFSNELSEVGVPGNLVGYWNFQQGSLADSIGNHAIATLHGSGSFNGNIVESFDYSTGPGGVIFTDTASDVFVGGWEGREKSTISTFVKPYTTSEDNEGMVFAKRGYHTGIVTYGNKFAAKVVGNPGSATNYTVYSGTFNADQWYHVAMTVDGYTIELFVDGVSQGTTTFAGTYSCSTADNLYLSYTLSTSYQFNGAMRFAKIHKRALTAGEIELESKSAHNTLSFANTGILHTDEIIEI